ncbi:TetR/AcrR family transcriptional regulator [Bermanella sp. R86510]|uniref:TetR/AcrR family transcriptional regulator n=1 Tax=unclassified Bermanella TaxID=2627862 RepID=UPI0037C97F7E
MNNATKQQVLMGARRCFFQHGYSASNMTLISQYAGYSRVTVHKHLRNKDDAFRQVCENFQQQATELCQPIVQNPDLDCWHALEAIMIIWLTPTFEEVSDEQVMGDLKYHAQTVAKDIFDQARDNIIAMCDVVLTQAIADKSIQLDGVAMGTKQLASIMIASLDGVRGHMPNHAVKSACEAILRVYQQATKC